MARRRRSRDAATENAAAGAEFRRQDRGLALARTRSTHRAGRRHRPGGRLMNTAIPRPSRFVHAGATRRIRVSFEFFPPKTAEMEQTLWEAVNRLAPLKPKFVSVTYGAGGSTRARTHDTVKRILAETMLVPAAHLTCVGATRAEV